MDQRYRVHSAVNDLISLVNQTNIGNEKKQIDGGKSPLKKDIPKWETKMTSTNEKKDFINKQMYSVIVEFVKTTDIIKHNKSKLWCCFKYNNKEIKAWFNLNRSVFYLALSNNFKIIDRNHVIGVACIVRSPDFKITMIDLLQNFLHSADTDFINTDWGMQP
jgi:hypothetical protein